jgi:hypothetical protein
LIYDVQNGLWKVEAYRNLHFWAHLQQVLRVAETILRVARVATQLGRMLLWLVQSCA